MIAFLIALLLALATSQAAPDVLGTRAQPAAPRFVSRGDDSTPAPSRGTVSGAPIGRATWYGSKSGLYAARHDWRYGDTPYAVSVCSYHDGRSWCLSLFVSDYCAGCGPNDVDLSPLAFRRLGYPLSRGVAKVSVEVLR